MTHHPPRRRRPPATVVVIAVAPCDGCVTGSINGFVAARVGDSRAAQNQSLCCPPLAPAQRCAVSRNAQQAKYKIARYPMAIQKRILVADRVRRPPAEGFSWIDRRFLRDFAPRLSGDAVFLYFFLAAVSDKHGLSFYTDGTIALRLRTSETVIAGSRDELITYDLVAYQPPLTQILSLPAARLQRGGPRATSALGNLFGDKNFSQDNNLGDSTS